MSTIVSDTSVVSNLALVGAAKLLPALFGKLIVPGEVWRELLRGAELYERLRFLRDTDWLEVRMVPQSASLTELSKEVDRDEAEAIILALDLKADLLLVDDSDGRTAAMRHGIPMGLLGVLIRAKERGLVERISGWIEELRLHTSFRMSDELVLHVLKAAGELP